MLLMYSTTQTYCNQNTPVAYTYNVNIFYTCMFIHNMLSLHYTARRKNEYEGVSSVEEI